MISETAEYALRAVVCMASEDTTCWPADGLAVKTKVPRRYLTRVLQSLCTAGLVASKSGPGGGYNLVRPSTEISVADVVNAISPIKRITKCPLGLRTHQKLCPLHAELDKNYAAFECSMKSVSIQAIVDSTSEIVPLCEAIKAKSVAKRSVSRAKPQKG